MPEPNIGRIGVGDAAAQGRRGRGGLAPPVRRGRCGARTTSAGSSSIVFRRKAALKGLTAGLPRYSIAVGERWHGPAVPARRYLQRRTHRRPAYLPGGCRASRMRPFSPLPPVIAASTVRLAVLRDTAAGCVRRGTAVEAAPAVWPIVEGLIPVAVPVPAPTAPGSGPSAAPGTATVAPMGASLAASFPPVSGSVTDRFPPRTGRERRVVRRTGPRFSACILLCEPQGNPRHPQRRTGAERTLRRPTRRSP